MRLIIVSNRLPVTIRYSEGKPVFQESAGGLVSGLQAYLDSIENSTLAIDECLWVGWPGGHVREADKAKVTSRLEKDYGSYPVFLTDRLMDKYYQGFCNKTIWPLFHYFLANAAFENDYWQAYQKVNHHFCESLVEMLKPDDLVWIQDFHLMLLPGLLREKCPELKIGYFHHIPFPTFEIYRLLPNKWREAILKGLCGANVVGFHTMSFTNYFLRGVLRVLGHNHRLGEVRLGGHRMKAAAFPMGIDFKKFEKTARKRVVKQKVVAFRKRIGKMKVVLSVDRLDYTKGVANRLLGFEQFLQDHPEWHGKVILHMLVVPSREGVEDYQQMKKKIDELVGRVNGDFATAKWSPVIYQYNFMEFEELVAMYRLSDVALITPLRDGMNLVCKEYLASQVDQTGVLILSERAGAAKELEHSIIVNPSHLDEISDGIHQALSLSAEDRRQRMSIMREHLRRRDVVRWADEFLHETIHVNEKERMDVIRPIFVTKANKKMLVDFGRSKRRLFLLDYDGTLRGFVKDPTKAAPNKEVRELLKGLATLPRTDLVIMSGRDQKTLTKWLGDLPIGMVAEHGASIRPIGSDSFVLRPTRQEWKVDILERLKRYCERLPGSFVEEKRCSLAWHCRACEPEQANIISIELIDDLVGFVANLDLQVLRGNKVVEIRVAGVSKGTAARTFLTRHRYDFIFAVGDDWTDEDTFEALPPQAYTVKVGLLPSQAKYNVVDIGENLKLLGTFLSEGGRQA